MKPLKNMNNVEKGKLLATLFPEQVRDILDNLKATYVFLTENEETLRNSWDNALLPFDFWYRQAAEVAATVDKHGEALKKSSSLFADRLFNGYNAIYTIDCIAKQAQSLPLLPDNQRYGLGVRLLFDYYTATK